MRLPFSEEQFLDVFAAFNRAFWPLGAVLWIAAAIVFVSWLRQRAPARVVMGLLAALWLTGALYHLVFFTAINPAAWLFGAAFMAEALLMLWIGATRPIAFERRRDWQSIAAAVLVVYSLCYPLLGLLFGLRFPRMPAFGVPCPTALITVGLLLSSREGVARALLIVPVLWCVIATSAALQLGIAADLALAVAAALGLAHMLARPRYATT
jgi:hypothetical protein